MKTFPTKKDLGKPKESHSQPCSSPIPTDDVDENEYDDSQRTDEDDDDAAKTQPDLLRDIWEKVSQMPSNVSSPRRGRHQTESNVHSPRRGRHQKACEACRQAKTRCSATKVSTTCPSALQQSCFLKIPTHSLVKIVRRRGSHAVMGRASALILSSLSNCSHRMIGISKTRV